MQAYRQTGRQTNRETDKLGRRRERELSVVSARASLVRLS